MEINGRAECPPAIHFAGLMPANFIPKLKINSMKKTIAMLAALLFFSLHFTAYPGQPGASYPIIYIFDASGSMWEKIGDKSKFEIATEVLTNSVNGLAEGQKVGLVVYGHRNEECTDVEFVAGADNSDKKLVAGKLGEIKPKGKTPLAYSVSNVIENLKQSKINSTVILITDGMESCGGNLCDVVREAKAAGIGLRLHIVGFGLKPDETEQLKCAAFAGDGSYFDASDASSLSNVLNEATSSTVDKSLPNLRVFTLKNGQPIDALIEVFSESDNTRMKVGRTYGDTAGIFVEPGKYTITAKPVQGDLSSVTMNGVECGKDAVTYKTVNFDGGKFTVTTLNNRTGWDALVKIVSPGTNKTVAQGRTYGKSSEFSIDPGTYNIELSAMNISGSSAKVILENITVGSGNANTVEHNFLSGDLSIGVKGSGGKLIDAVVSVRDVATGENAGQGRTYESSSSNPKKFTLSPGTYEVTVKPIDKQYGSEQRISVEVTAEAVTEKVITF